MESPTVVRFGPFELDLAKEQLRRDGAVVRLQPQPFRLLTLLVSRSGNVVTREEIRHALWDPETYVDFDQGVNFTMRQVRAALGDDAERPLFVETVPRRGYRFLAPIEAPAGAAPATPSGRSGETGLQKALWANIVELREAERRRKRYATGTVVVVACLLAAALIVIWLILP